MKKNAIISAITGAALMLGACGANDQNSESESFPIINTQGSEIGALMISPLAGGGVELNVTVSGLEPGTRAMHIHETGSCITPDFKSAGGHYNPAGAAHGHVEDGPHAGDMMNVEANAEGNGSFNVTNDKVNIAGGSLPALKDADGTALIIHAGADDYESQPSGAAGPRIACAVIPAG